jgi:superfamily II DNA or RNA helicase
MFLLITSPKHSTLIQLATGFGKSLMLALMAQWINMFRDKKVIVVVPSAFLHAYQQFFYCRSASEIPDDITDSSCKDIFYCSYDRFNAPEFKMPADTTILVDEFHELFFNQSVAVVNGKLVSTILKFKAATKLIGVSATFRGDAGIKKISNIMDA